VNEFVDTAVEKLQQIERGFRQLSERLRKRVGLQADSAFLENGGKRSLCVVLLLRAKYAVRNEFAGRCRGVDRAGAV
jgi:hypothetical protein